MVNPSPPPPPKRASILSAVWLDVWIISVVNGRAGYNRIGVSAADVLGERRVCVSPPEGKCTVHPILSRPVCRLLAEWSRVHYTLLAYFFFFFFISTKSRRGYNFHCNLSLCVSVCLSVCLWVCMSACEQNFNRTDAPILTQFSQNDCLPNWLVPNCIWWSWVKGQGHCDVIFILS